MPPAGNTASTLFVVAVVVGVVDDVLVVVASLATLDANHQRRCFALTRPNVVVQQTY